MVVVDQLGDESAPLAGPELRPVVQQVVQNLAFGRIGQSGDDPLADPDPFSDQRIPAGTTSKVGLPNRTNDGEDAIS